jgi:hypothetical protein
VYVCVGVVKVNATGWWMNLLIKTGRNTKPEPFKTGVEGINGLYTLLS